jgi:hypothetical protein
MGQTEVIGEFVTPLDDKRIIIERNNSGSMGGYTMSISLVDQNNHSTEVLATKRYGYGGNLHWIDDSNFCLVFEGTKTNFRLAESCEGEFVEYFDL